MSAKATPDYWLLPVDRLPSNGTQVLSVHGNASDDVTAAPGNASSSAGANPQLLADSAILSIVCVGLQSVLPKLHWSDLLYVIVDMLYGNSTTYPSQR